ncbi:Putative S-adenosyl-L-methionine-dependent methyltransferase [Thioalkalivibrio nitratireducens DSM 14787]|uniref:S-adenosyl-L-methionine-dependent methyltransferase n=1 Tax=Thioalkalivibrio nitratireducens (strain DSM 14787 / UNIQEM 213 / ALEN2) TaxID=1255043 RepID=L0DSD4_THIND|nr:SAM-dependent methyltransferase [Thioalkalivibrio nitratireducens]AGA31897.1 Putative S-adenosyl-L-methionine-dependent methyltransferase [Thioalkalivibrio nitratireducens DSM 14787]
MVARPESSTPDGSRPRHEPAAEALALSARLHDRIRAAIKAGGGFLPFSRYMEMALYEPGLGYYVNGLRKLGADGDFVTAPELSPLFGAALAQWLGPVLDGTRCEILEFGAGSGRLAADVIQRLDDLGVRLERYRILEVSPDLRARQQSLLAARLGSERMVRVEWLDRLPAEPLQGVVLANEVLDAMPVELFAWREGRVLQRGVVTQDADNGLGFAERPAPPWLDRAVRDLQRQAGPWPDGYVSELRPAVPPWLRSVVDALAEGIVWIADYGYPRREFYAPERGAGTLVGYYRQQLVFDPFAWPGLMDLTASVDFTAVAEAAHSAGLEVLAYAAQGEFLLGAGLPALFEQAVAGNDDPRHIMQLAQQVRMLTLPGEMGERFQVMVLGSNCDLPPGGSFPDRRERL